MSTAQPLQGLTVIELCNVAAGPFCGMLLADMGAEVLKIEHPDGGDTLRSWPPITDGYSENFASLNRNKKSVTFNLKVPADRNLVLDIIKSADVLIENNRPGVMKRLGLDYETVSKLNAKLVYCSISAYGQSGPRSQEGGFDLTIQAMSGVMAVTGTNDGPPVKCGVPIADFSAGLYAAFAIASTMRDVERTGKGTHIDVSMLGATLAIGALQTSEYFGTNNNPRKLGSAHPRNAPYQAFRCSDGYFALAAGNNALWHHVCHAVERPDLIENPDFGSTTLRAQHQETIKNLLEDIFVLKDAEHWLQVFRDKGVPCAPINNYSDILNDPQVEHMEWVQDIELPNGVKTRTFASPLKFNGVAPPIRLMPPALGANTTEVLDRLVPTC